MHNFKNLKVWQKSVDLAVKIYQATTEFPSSEKFGITSQMRRAGVSILLLRVQQNLHPNPFQILLRLV